MLEDKLHTVDPASIIISGDRPRQRKDIGEIKKMVEAEKNLIAKENLFSLFSEVFIEEFHKILRGSSNKLAPPYENDKNNDPKVYGTPSVEFEIFVTLPEKAGNINLLFLKGVNKKAIAAIATQKKPGSPMDNQRREIDKTLINIINSIK